MVNVTGLELALIPAGAAIAAASLTTLGQGWLDRLKDRRAARDLRDQAIAELLASAADMIQGVQAIRAAYEGQSGWRDIIRKSAAVMAAVGSILPGERGDPMPRTRAEWSKMLDWRTSGPFVDRTLAEIQRLDNKQRTTVIDVAALLLPRTARFYAAVSVLTLGPDKEISSAVRQMTPAVMRLTEVIVSKPGVYGRARRKAEDALTEFRETVDRRRRMTKRMKKW